MNKLYPKRLLLLFFASLYVIAVQASYLRNVPQKLVQPNGAIVNCFASGDEFYHWLHDEEGYTIVQDSKTGYFCYAVLSNDKLVASSYIVGQTSPSSVGLTPKINISPKRMGEIRERFLNMEKSYLSKSGKIKSTPKVNTTGVLNNVVVYIRFASESEYTQSQTVYTEKFNSTTAGVLSQHNYFDEVSYGTLNMSTRFLPTNNGTNIVSFQDTHTRDYYKIFNETSNPNGYSTDNERVEREHTLLKAAIDYVAGQLDASINIDNDNDGYVDNVCFIVQGSSEGWSELLWPHKWSLYSKTAYINGKQVNIYNFQLQNDLDVSVLCHEMFHTLGAPDLYHYTDGNPDPVGQWDVMNANLPTPQHMTQYMKFRYGKWIDNIPEITASGDYTLNPVTVKANSCYKIKSPYSTTEYFVIEYRKKEKTDIELPNEGLLIYRINSAADGQGNKNGPPDEVYIYRPNGSSTSEGDLKSATFSSDLGKTTFNDKTNPDPFLSNGNIGGINISNISAIGSTMSFHVDITSPANIDVAATKLITPVSSPSLTSTEKIKVNISGLGLNSVSSGVKVNYKINNGTAVSEDFTGTLDYGKSVPFEFTTTANLSSPGTYVIKVYTTLAGDEKTDNDTIIATVVNPIPLGYLAGYAATATSTYSEISTGTVISVDQDKDGLSSPITFPDGFTFNYSGVSFSQFILSTNGFIKLGNGNPSSRSLYFTAPQTADGGIFNSTSELDNNIIAPFNHDLKPGDGGAEYRMDISGTAPNRVVTIQFKNVRDNDTPMANQYSSMKFQIKLYETSNIIEFVYGTWIASSNSSAFKTSLCGLRGQGNLPSQLLAVNKGSTTAWAQATFANGNYSTTATLNFGNSTGGSRPAPDAGRIFRFLPQKQNDLSVKEIYTLGQIPIGYGTPHIISAVIVNEGKSAQSNVNVALGVTGANTFSPAAVLIPTINPRDSIVVSFAEFTPTVAGTNNITISLPADDFETNNTKSIAQIVSSNKVSYASSTATAESAIKNSYIAACKYHIKGSARITSVDAAILNNTALVDQTAKAYVLNSSGAIVGQSSTFTVTSSNLGKWVSFTILAPPQITDADYYVGLDCSNGYFAAYKVEKPSRSNAYYKFATTGGTPEAFTKNQALLIGATISPLTGIDPNIDNSIKIYSDSKDIFVSIPEIQGKAELYVYNILGNQVYQATSLTQGVNRIEGNFVPGTYIVKVMVDGKVLTRKVLLSK